MVTNNHEFQIAVIGGDGIGVEVMNATLEILKVAEKIVGGFHLQCQPLKAGAFCYEQTGEALPSETLLASEQADAILLGACGWPGIRYKDGTEIRPQVDLRLVLELYAGVRPIKSYAGVPNVLANAGQHPIDFVLIRESTEGMFASKGGKAGNFAATETMIITRQNTERLMHFSYQLAERRKAAGHAGSLTCVDKSNIFQAMGFYRQIYDEIGAKYANVGKDYCYVDAMALNMVLKPWDYDVMVMENLFGDILSDLGAGLVGGLGMAPSADIGDNQAVFQPSHGTAPDIAGKGLANPVAMVLSGAMMCEYLAESRAQTDSEAAKGLLKAAQLLENAVAKTLQNTAMHTRDIGGTASTTQITDHIIQMMEAA